MRPRSPSGMTTSLSNWTPHDRRSLRVWRSTSALLDLEVTTNTLPPDSRMARDRTAKNSGRLDMEPSMSSATFIGAMVPEGGGGAKAEGGGREATEGRSRARVSSRYGVRKAKSTMQIRPVTRRQHETCPWLDPHHRHTITGSGEDHLATSRAKQHPSVRHLPLGSRVSRRAALRSSHVS